MLGRDPLPPVPSCPEIEYWHRNKGSLLIVKFLNPHVGTEVSGRSRHGGRHSLLFAGQSDEITANRRPPPLPVLVSALRPRSTGGE